MLPVLGTRTRAWSVGKPLLAHIGAIAAYCGVAVVFTWPLPRHFFSTLLGSPTGDTGSYIWNLWLFRHLIVAHGSLPFTTSDILSLSAPVPLTLHNYTTAAAVVGVLLQPVLGLVATYNLLLTGSCVLSAYAMFLLTRRLVDDAASAWLAGLVFGFSPYMSARATAHFSLVQAAPLPLFLLLLERLRTTWASKTGVALGAVIGWAYLSDPYYAVYCLLMAAFAVGSAVCAITREDTPRPHPNVRIAIDAGLVCITALILRVALYGGGRLEVFNLHLSVNHLHTPVLVWSTLLLGRLWLAFRPRFSLSLPRLRPYARIAIFSLIGCAAVLSPLLYSLHSHLSQRSWINPKVLWRSSPPGHDLLAFFVPNPMHVWLGAPFRDEIASMANGFDENIAAIPLTLIIVVIVGVVGRRATLPRKWVAFTALSGLLAMGPFIHIAGVNTHLPTPWAFLRYVPIVGAARMPTRLAILVMVGASILLAFVIRDLRRAGHWPRLGAPVLGALLLLELLPAPRTLHSAALPSFYEIIRADPRPVRVLNLPFGLSDGMNSYGNMTPASLYAQTLHEKSLLGGALSRLPESLVDYYKRRRVTSVLLELSAGRQLPADRIASAIQRAHEVRDELRIGYVVVDMGRASPELLDFASAAFPMVPITSEGPYHLFRTTLASP